MQKQIEEFLKSPAFAVIGASTDRIKYGNKILRCYIQNRMTVYPVHPKEKIIEGLPAIASIMELPLEVESISIITPPQITEQIVTQAISKGIRTIWMQPGAESEKAIHECEEHRINLIAKGPCLLVLLAYREDTYS